MNEEKIIEIYNKNKKNFYSYYPRIFFLCT